MAVPVFENYGHDLKGNVFSGGFVTALTQPIAFLKAKKFKALWFFSEAMVKRLEETTEKTSN